MVTELNNLDKLTDRIYKAAIEKAEKESKALLEQAASERESILVRANEEAAQIVANARKEAVRMARSTENELMLKGKQLISDLKSEIEGILSEKILDRGIKGALADTAFLQSVITEVVSYWKSVDDLELILPDSLEKKVKEALRRSIVENLPNLTISFSDRLTGGFRIARKSEGYQVSFGEEDFITLFRSYLTEQTSHLLFSH